MQLQVSFHLNAFNTQTATSTCAIQQNDLIMEVTPGFWVHIHAGQAAHTDTNFGISESCICPQTTVYNLTYECTAVGAGITLWTGTAFNCVSSGDEISLRHSLFRGPPGSANGNCNNGNITGHSVGVLNGNHYNSQLHILYNPGLLGHTVECIHDDIVNSTPQTIGNSTIAIIGGTVSCIHM